MSFYCVLIKLVKGTSDTSGNMEHVCTFPHVLYPSDILWSTDVRGEVNVNIQVKPNHLTVLLLRHYCPYKKKNGSEEYYLVVNLKKIKT